MDVKEEADIIPTENGAEGFIKFVEMERVRHSDDADDHGTHIAEDRSKNQSLEGDAYAHSLSLPDAPEPLTPGSLLHSKHSDKAVELA